jgi:hypothetical protein
VEVLIDWDNKSLNGQFAVVQVNGMRIYGLEELKSIRMENRKEIGGKLGLRKEVLKFLVVEIEREALENGLDLIEG